MEGLQRLEKSAQIVINAIILPRFVMLRKKKPVDALEELKSEDEEEEYMVEELQVSAVCDTKQSSNDWYIVSFSVKGRKVEFKCDSGAQVNVFILKQCLKLGVSSRDLIKTKSVITSFTKDRLPVVGKCNLPCRYKAIDYLIEFYVVDIDCFNIIGLKTSEQLGFIVRVETISKDVKC